MKIFTYVLILLSLVEVIDVSACPVDSKGCDRPKPDKAHIFFQLTGLGKSHDEARKALNELNTATKKAIEAVGGNKVKIDLSGVFVQNNPALPKKDNVGVVQYGALEYRLSTSNQSQDELLTGLTQLIDAAVSSGAAPISPHQLDLSGFGTNVGADDPFGFEKYSSYTGRGSPNYVLFTVSELEPYVENAIKNGLVRISAAGDIFGKLINEKPKGLDNLAISYEAELRPWKKLTFGPISYTLDDVNINVNLRADVHFSHADLSTGSNGAHGHSHGGSSKQTISATGRGFVTVPVEKALVLRNFEVTAAKASECIKLLEDRLQSLKTKLSADKSSGIELGMSGVGFVAKESYSYSHNISFTDIVTGGINQEPALTKKLGCYRDLNISITRTSKEPIEVFSDRVNKVMNDPLFANEAPSHTYQQFGKETARVYYLSQDLNPLVMEALSSAFADAQIKAKRLAEIRGDKLGAVSSLHPEGNISLEELLDQIKLGTESSWNRGLSLRPATTEQRISAELTVAYEIGG